MGKKGLLTVISGFSGSGKGTVLKILKDKYEDYKISVSCTTRSMREGEKEGVDYFYKTDDQFEEMIENDGFLEYAGFVGRYYGTPKDMVDKWLFEGQNVILEIEVNGAMQVMKKRPDAVFIFMLPPSVSELRKRLFSRNREAREEMKNRLNQSGREIKFAEKYDYIVVNDSAEKCAENINDIVKTVSGQKNLDISSFKSDNKENTALINKIKEELNKQCI